MALRRRSIRRRIFLLILVPLLSLIGLYAFALTITAGNAVSEAQTRAIENQTLLPIGNYEAQVFAERRLAVMYLTTPTSQARAQLTAQETATDKVRSLMRAAVTSGATMGIATAQEKQAIAAMLRDAASLDALRSRVAARATGRMRAMGAYDQIVTDCEQTLIAGVVRERNSTVVALALPLVQLNESEDLLLREDALVESDLAARSYPMADRREIAELAGARRTMLAAALRNLGTQNRDEFAKDVPAQSLASLISLEDSLISDDRVAGPPPVQLGVWGFDVAEVALGSAKAAIQGGTNVAERQTQIARQVYLELILAGGLGLLAVIVSVAVTVRTGRGLIRQLAGLRRSALTLADEQLPGVVARLRAGEDVDVSAEAPPIEPSPDEIGQVGDAFNAVQRTAVEAAVDQATLRRGVSDVFRNLARRSQSLLHRQLTLLDTMERRASDPDQLGDLYRLDHLTTRMRRHAESLIILSGAVPGRSWRKPVPLVDVLRAAIAEVEDYTRVNVVMMSQAALAGPAVADTIHMIAELVENATIFSPPRTPVRVTGDVVGRGFAVDIEDRGLGLTEEETAAANSRLASPGEFDLSDSSQLGLFVAGRLAARHGIRISLRPNPYGGTTAIVLIPQELVVGEGDHADDAPAEAADGDAPPQTGRHSLRSDFIPAATSPQSTSPQSTLRRAGSTSQLTVPDANGVPAVQTDVDWFGPTGEGLPRRVRQASLAAELRHEPSPAAEVPGGDAADYPSPEEALATMSAIQRGWERGRAEADSPDPEPGTEAGHDATDGSQQ